MTKVPTQSIFKFDILDYLDIPESARINSNNLKEKLENNISEYILIRLLDELPDAVDERLETKGIKSIGELEEMLRSYIPDFDEKVRLYLKDFKEQYQND